MSGQAALRIDTSLSLTPSASYYMPVLTTNPTLSSFAPLTGLGAGLVDMDALRDFFQGGTSDEFLSTVAIATPSALAATTFVGFASTVSGGVLMGYGTTHDVALKNRAGTTVLGVTSNTSDVTMAGALAMTGALSGVTTAALSSTATITQGTANTAVLVSTGYSLTGSSAVGMVSLTGTWNTSGTPTAVSINITNTSSNANSLLFAINAGSGGVTEALSVSANGRLTITRLTGNSTSFVRSGYSLTGSSTAASETWSGTWNTSGAPTALQFSLTRTAADAASLYFDYRAGSAGSTSLLSLGVTGATTGLLTIDGASYGAGVASLRLNGLTSGAGANTGTLTNSPHTGNPAFWCPINIAGTVYVFPCFATS